MKTTIAALTFILIAGVAGASLPEVPAGSADPGVAAVPAVPAEAQLPSMNGALASPKPGVVCFEPLDALGPEPIQVASLCTRLCRIQWIDCIEIYPAFECDVSYQLCLANC